MERGKKGPVLLVQLTKSALPGGGKEYEDHTSPWLASWAKKAGEIVERETQR